MMNKAILLKSNDWEGLYIDGKLVYDGHIDDMNEGEERLTFFIKLANEYKFELKDIKVRNLEFNDIVNAEWNGYFPDNIDEFKFKYNNEPNNMTFDCRATKTIEVDWRLSAPDKKTARRLFVIWLEEFHPEIDTTHDIDYIKEIKEDEENKI